jgi:uncharacterized protein YndB with AHSA1/START domain
MILREAPVAKVEMTIRRPIADVFAAFVDPTITTKFWFTRASGKLEPGARVRWDWEMYGVGADVDVKALDPNKRIVIEWDGANGRTFVEWLFTPRGENETNVAITNSGFGGDGDAIVGEALDSTQGFTFVLSGLKAWMEHGVALNLIADKAPDAHVKTWRHA